uniref:Uncharacterized protein n=1 Tax=Timema poppense TaxID=170557 RepID=A0A7R9D7R0_TIMPO|nr:unnamed protein product [Timema poppensis]
MLSPAYFAESVTSEVGFWGVACPGYFQHVLGWCPDALTTLHQRVQMGEPCKPETFGVFFVETNDHPPFAKG